MSRKDLIIVILLVTSIVISYITFVGYYVEWRMNTNPKNSSIINNTITQNFCDQCSSTPQKNDSESHAPVSITIDRDKLKPIRSSSAIGIGILLPTTSRNSGGYCAHCLNILSVGMRELVHTIPYNDTTYWYTVYVGYDDGDTMWDHPGRLKANLDIANQLFWRQPVEVKAVRVIRYPNPSKGSLTNVWNKLCEAALNDGNEYVFLDNDDLIIETQNFIPKLVHALSHNPVFPGLGEAAPLDVSFPDEAHPTFPLVSRVHFEIFGQMYSTEIFSRGCDTWLGDVYRGFNSVISVKEVTVLNTAYDTARRYDNDFNDYHYRRLVIEGRTAIKQFLIAKGINGSWPTDLCSVTKTFGC